MKPKNKKKVTYNQLMSYIDFLENKLNFNINVLSRTIDHYIRFRKDDKKFMKYLKASEELTDEKNISKKK